MRFLKITILPQIKYGTWMNRVCLPFKGEQRKFYTTKDRKQVEALTSAERGQHLTI
jgi:hypothetical protein